MKSLTQLIIKNGMKNLKSYSNLYTKIKGGLKRERVHSASGAIIRGRPRREMDIIGSRRCRSRSWTGLGSTGARPWRRSSGGTRTLRRCGGFASSTGGGRSSTRVRSAGGATHRGRQGRVGGGSGSLRRRFRSWMRSGSTGAGQRRRRCQ